MALLRRTREQPADLACPRCGYDVAGQAKAAGIDAAAARASKSVTPCAGRCPECGLEFDWLNVLDPSRVDVAWLYEHTPVGQSGYGRAWKTLARVFAPLRFWRTVGVSSRLSVRRLLLWLVVLILPLQVIWSCTNATRVWSTVRTTVAASGGRLPAGYTRMSVLEAIGHPLVQIEFMPPGNWAIGLADVSYTFVLPLGASLLMPVLLLVLSRSRATSKIRSAHVLRAGIYGLAWIPCWYVLWTSVSVGMLILETLGAAPKWGWAGPTILGIPIGRVGGGAVVLCLVWFAAWWWCAIRIGFRMRHAALVWTLLMIACLLLGVVLATLDRDFLNWMGSRLI